MSVLRITPDGPQPAGESLAPIVESLERAALAARAIPVDRLLALFDDFSGRLLARPRTRHLEGVVFLSAWLGRRNLQQIAAN